MTHFETHSEPASLARQSVAVIGGGPAGLMAAETIAAAGHAVTIFDAMPTVGRKLLMAGKSGLNLTHAEPMADFSGRFGTAADRLAPALAALDNRAAREWAAGLGIDTFEGSSGRVFPIAMKSSPLLRALLARLDGLGVAIRTRYRWTGFDGDALAFATPEGPTTVAADATVLALGGASWPRLGSDAAWVPWLAARGVAVRPFQPANCGFDVAWSAHISDRFAGAPVKGVRATSAAGTSVGEFVISRHGIEGSLVYAHAAALRDGLAVDGHAVLVVDLAPQRSVEALATALARQKGKASFSTRLRKAVGLDGVKAALVREFTSGAVRGDFSALAQAIKALAIPVVAPRPIAEAISSAGGVAWDAIGPDYQLATLPGVFVCGEMIDWEAPTGGYLLTACLATGRAAGTEVVAMLAGASSSSFNGNAEMR